MGFVPYPYPFVVGTPDMYARALSTPMVLPSPSHPLYRPAPQTSPNTELSNSSGFYDDEALENERRHVENRVQLPRDSPTYGSLRTDNLPVYHEESTECAPPLASAVKQEVSLPMASPETTRDSADFINSLVAGSPWRPVSNSIGVRVKAEERGPEIGPLRRTRSTRSKRTSAIAVDELDEESKVSDSGYFPR